MKTKEEIEQLAERYADGYSTEEAHASYIAFQDGYTKCQEDMKPILEDLFSLWQHLARIGEISVGKNFTKKYEEVKKSLNKQD